MTFLVDTNVLLRSVQETHSMHSDAVRALDLLLDNSAPVAIIAQNLIEFWSVATRPQSSNGLGLSIDKTALQVASFQSVFNLLPDTDQIFQEWEHLVIQHQVSGKQVYDARLVAAMRVHELTHLLTFNTSDFQRFPFITAINPKDINEGVEIPDLPGGAE